MLISVPNTPKEDLLKSEGKLHWYQVIKHKTQGSMTAGTFDGHLRDLVHYLVYAGEPYRNEREALGIWVLGFLLIFFVVMVALKQAYWKDIKGKD